MIEARNSIHSLLETVQEQQEQFTNIASLCDTDAAIPVAFTKDNRVHIGPKMEMRVVALGLDGAGKTSILFKMKQDEFVSPITTIGNSLFFSSFCYTASWGILWNFILNWCCCSWFCIITVYIIYS